MKIPVKITSEIEISHIRLELHVRYGEEDIPNDFPLRDNDMWRATVEIDTGKIIGWPPNEPPSELSMKVCDEGIYELLAPDGKVVAKIEENYVPNGCVPGEYGDYVQLTINGEGIITNWPRRPDVSAFFPSDE